MDIPSKIEPSCLKWFTNEPNDCGQLHRRQLCMYKRRPQPDTNGPYFSIGNK